MNVKNILAVAKCFEQDQNHNQRVWFHSGGTPSSIVGWACHLAGWKIKHIDYDGNVFVRKDRQVRPAGAVAQEFMGLDTYTANILFGEFNMDNDKNSATELRYLVEMGRVAWCRNFDKDKF